MVIMMNEQVLLTNKPTIKDHDFIELFYVTVMNAKPNKKETPKDGN